MLLSIDFGSEQPIYIQLKTQIIRAIASGELSPGEKIPSIRAMAEELGINLHTVNKVYSQLKESGYIIMDRRRGASVSLSHTNVPLDAIREELYSTASEALCAGVSKEKFLELCKDAYERMG